MGLTPTILEAAVWTFLGLAVATQFLRWRLSWVLLGAAITCALAASRLTGIGLVSIASGFALAFLLRPQVHERLPVSFQPWSGGVLQFLLVAWSLALMAHILPGFNNLLVLDKVQSGPASMPYTLYLNLDKPMIFFAMMIAFPGMLTIQRTRFTALKKGPLHAGLAAGEWATLLVLFLMVMILALVAGFIRPELTVPGWIWLFALNNLLLTCVAEETLFRGYLQNLIARKAGMAVAVVAAGCLFGVAHYLGGLTYVVLSSVAGILYGLVYCISGRLLAAVVVHFLLNLTHLVFFTYPVALRVRQVARMRLFGDC